MGYRPEEFDEAFAKVVEKYPFVRRSVAEQVLGHLERLTRENDRKVQAKKQTYRQLIYEALHDANVKGELGQKPYKSMIGYIFGRHGNYVAKRQREDQKLRPPLPRFPTKTSTPDTYERPNGQLSWKF